MLTKVAQGIWDVGSLNEYKEHYQAHAGDRFNDFKRSPKVPVFTGSTS